MTDFIYHELADELKQLSGSELKAIIAIYSEGQYLNSNDMMAITGMARKTCLQVMKSEHVKKHLKRVRSNGQKTNYREIINLIRQELNKLHEEPAK